MTAWRILLLLAAVITLCVAVDDLIVRLRCPQRLQLQASALGGLTSPEFFWARVDGLIAPTSPIVISSESGTNRGAYLALSSPRDPGRAVGVLFSKVVGEIHKVYSQTGPFSVEGLSYFPSSGDEAFLDNYLSRAGLEGAAPVRYIEMKRQPVGLAAIGGLFLLAFLGGLVALTGIGQRGSVGAKIREVWSSVATRTRELLPERFGPRATFESGPLPEDVKIRVRNIMTEVWEEAATTAK